MGMRRLIAIAGLAMLTSGCATYSWYRPDTPPDLAARDKAECYELARDSARDIALSAFPRLHGPSWPMLGYHPWSDPYWGPFGDPLWRLDVEQRVQESCMRSRGYDLQREPKA
jgi:hypothetical protein